MADFRRWVTALAVLALFAGLAAAQTGATGTTPLVCNSVAQVTPTLRAEGVTELVGDIVITCSGGNMLANGTLIPQANLVVSLTAPVTSRLRSSSSGASEALLLIDEPNSGLTAPVPGFGPAAPLNVCTSVSGGCLEYVATPAGGTIQVATDTIGGTTPGKNVFEGVVSGNQVSFNGIPILPPVTSGVNRVYRITNIRVNASGATGGVAGGIVPIQAYLSATGSTSLPVSNAALTVGFVQTSLSLSVTNDKTSGGTATSTATNVFTQCNSPSDIVTTTSGTAVNLGKVALLNFTENFPSAFKTRVGINPATGAYTSPIVGTNSAPFSYLGTSGTGAGYTQNVPGTLYNSESGFILDVGSIPGSSTPFVAGLADSGTRFQAVFNNIPTGATIYVSRYTMTSFTTASASNIGLPPATGSTQGSVAALTTGGAAGAFSDYSASKPQYIGASPVEVVPLTATNGSATAVWEVVNTNTSQNETFSFGVYIAYTPNLTSNQPTPGNAATVTLSYAPLTSTSTTWIPRFIAGAASTAQPLVTINKCNTVLLFPYITAAAGFDTGIAISNTSMDPLTPATQQSTGSCALNFYGANAPTGTVAPLGPIPAGNGTDPTKFAFMLSTVAPNFTGYMFAVCDFQYAHGFAFISDVGTRNLAMGYLALVVNPGGQITRPSKPSGESFGQ